MTPILAVVILVGLPFGIVAIRFAVKEQARTGRELRADLYELEATRTREPERVHLITDLPPAEDDYAPISPDLFDRHERR